MSFWAQKKISKNQIKNQNLNLKKKWTKIEQWNHQNDEILNGKKKELISKITRKKSYLIIHVHQFGQHDRCWSMPGQRDTNTAAVTQANTRGNTHTHKRKHKQVEQLHRIILLLTRLVPASEWMGPVFLAYSVQKEPGYRYSHVHFLSVVGKWFESSQWQQRSSRKRTGAPPPPPFSTGIALKNP